MEGARTVRSEAGFGIIEVLVAAVLVVLSALGLYAGLDSSDKTAGVNRMRSLASNVAQDDQEHLRSLTPGALSNYRNTYSAKSSGATFTVVSRGDWVTDPSGATGCTSGVKASYIKVSSTVTWPGMRIKPIAISSIITAANGAFDDNHGSLAVAVVNAAGDPLPGVPVSIAGNGASFSDTTNDAGCVLWGELPVGSYPVTVDSSGTDPSGHTPPSVTCGVVGGDTSSCTVQVDNPGAIDATFDSDPGNLLGKSSPRAVLGDTVTIAHSRLLAPGYRTFGTVGTTASKLTATSVFPFSDAYAVYAGNCPGADPRNYNQQPAYVTMGPGAHVAATVREPALNLRLTKLGAAVSGVGVKVTATAQGCSGTRAMTTNAQGQLVKPGLPATSLDNGLPYGTYDVCLQLTGNSTLTLRGISDTKPNGTTVLPIDVSSTLGLTTATVRALTGLVTSTLQGTGTCQ